MINPRHLCALFVLCLSRCHAIAPPPAPPPPPPPPRIATSGSTVPAEVLVDLSEAPTPASLVMDVRLASARGFANRLGRLTGMNDGMVQLLESALPGMLSDDEGIASVIDLNSPVDISVYRSDSSSLRLALAMGAGELSHALSVLSDAHTLTAEGNGIRRIAQTGEHPPPDPECLISPAFGASGARVVCAERGQDLGQIAPYLTRTLPRRPFGAVDLMAVIAMPEIRVSLAGDARDAARDLTHELGFDRTSPEASLESARIWAREMAQSIPRVLNDVGQAELGVSLPDTGAEATATFRIDRTTAPLLRQLLDITRDPSPPFADIGRLPTGAWLYGAASLSLQQLRPSLNVLPTLLTYEILQGTPTPNGEGAALNTAIASLLAQDRITYATSLGIDSAGHGWNVSRFQATTPPAQLIANLRSFFTALTRPVVVRSVLTHQHLQFSQWRSMPTTGLPPGSFMVRIPFERVIAPSAARARPAFGASPVAVPPVYEVLFVPEGAYVWFVAATNARERLRAAQTPHAPAVDAQTLQGANVSCAAAIIPSAAVGLIRNDPSFARMLTRLVHGASDHGMTPALVRLSTTQGSTSEITVRASVPRATLELIGQALHGVGGGAPARP